MECGRQRIFRGGEQFVGIGTVAINRLGVLGQFFLVGNRDDRQRTRQRRPDIRKRPHRGRLLLGRHRFLGRNRFLGWRGREGIRPGLIALAYADQEPLAVGSDGQRRGIPARGDESLHLAAAGLGNVDHGHTVVVGVGHIQGLAVGGDGQRVGRAAFRCLGNSAVAIVSRTVPSRVSITDTEFSTRTPRRAGRPADGPRADWDVADADFGHHAQLGRVDRQHAPGGPIRDIQPRSVAGRHYVVGPDADLAAPRRGLAGQIAGRDRPGVDIQHVQQAGAASSATPLTK